MGFLDDVVNKSVPQGSGLAKPLYAGFSSLVCLCSLGGVPYAQGGSALGTGYEPSVRAGCWRIVRRIGRTARKAPTGRSW